MAKGILLRIPRRGDIVVNSAWRVYMGCVCRVSIVVVLRD
jgi:hypothetical protein